ncbi:MAG: 2-oxoacid:acceptor oxidoreductase subunit alpha [Thermoanaerobaculia bacterium]
MPTRDLTLAMVGSGGDGVVTMGDMMAQAGARDGLNVIKVEAYGPQIRGGESSCVLRMSAEPISAQGDAVDVLVVFNWADFARFKGEVVPKADAVILYEASDPTPLAEVKIPTATNATWIPVPFVEIATKATGTKAAKNIVTLGILAELFGIPPASVRKAIEFKFGKKKAGVLEANLKGFTAGQEFADTIEADVSARKLEYEVRATKLVMTGNEACAVAALHAGCRFFAGYPITPSSEVLHFLSEWLPKAGGRIVQTEDELSALGAIIGGSFAGVKSMTSTSGPGVSLMAEMLGLASMAEVPCVILDVQRGGPSTGLPTKSEQSDLFISVFGSHGDAPRVVLAPVDVEDCFHTTVDAFNIAEEAQLPVLILSDQAIGQRRQTVEAANLVHAVIDRRTPAADELADYRRYVDTPNGVSPMTFPSMKDGIYQTNGLEHDEMARPASSHVMHEKMSKKRFRKLPWLEEKYPLFQRLGPEKADVGIVCWGSSKGPVEEAMKELSARGVRVSAFVPRIIMPFPKKALLEYMASVKTLMFIEVNFVGQLYLYLRTMVEFPADTRVFTRSGGMNLSVTEVISRVESVLSEAGAREEVTA